MCFTWPCHLHSLFALLFLFFCRPDLFDKQTIQIRADILGDIDQVRIRQWPTNQFLIRHPHQVFRESTIYHPAGLIMQKAFAAIDES